MAAAAGNNTGINLPDIDESCRYTNLIRARPEGKVACFCLGPTASLEIEDADLGEIGGICFQKLDTGTSNVKAALRVDSFLPVTWEDAPTRPPPDPDPAPAPAPAGQQALVRVRNLNNRLDLVQVQANNVRPEWQEFTNALRLAKNAMLVRMNPAPVPNQPPTQQPVYLLDGFHEETWIGAPDDDMSLTSPAVMLLQIKNDIGNAANWSESINNWMLSLCGGLYNPEDNFKAVFQYLLPNCQKPNHEQVLIRVASATKSGGIQDGDVRCLVYGYQEEQLRQNGRGRQRNRNLEHRFLLPRRSGDVSRSRSRSPASSDDEEDLNQNVRDPQNPHRRFIRGNALLNDPEKYLVKPEKLHVYFESHKPDLVLLQQRIVPDPVYPGYNKAEYVVKMVVEISSIEKHVDDVVEHIRKNVKQCVQSCLAAIACDQDLIYGLVVVVDGFVLIKVQKQNVGGQETYEITETDLVMWDNAEDLNALFSTLNNVL